MESRSPCGCATATGPLVRMQPDSASAVMIAVIGNRNARATRTGAIPQSETGLVLHRLWLTNRFWGMIAGAEDSLAPACGQRARGALGGVGLAVPHPTLRVDLFRQAGQGKKETIRRPRPYRSGTTRRCRPSRNSRPDSWRDIADDSARRNRIGPMARSRW